MFNLNIIFALIIGYVFGSIPFALVIGKVFYKTDVRQHGSGNLGGSNAGRVLGKKAGITVILLDAFKSVIAMALANLIDPSTMMFTGFAAAVGHCYPMFANFKGGKAVATIAGYVLGLIFFGYIPFYNALIPLAVFLITLKITKYVSLSSIIMLGLAAVMTLINGGLAEGLSLLMLWAFSTYRHRANIVRIKNGNENKVTWI